MILVITICKNSTKFPYLKIMELKWRDAKAGVSYHNKESVVQQESVSKPPNLLQSQDKCSNSMRVNSSARPSYKKEACMSPIRWLDIHPLNSPHVSDFIAGLCIPSSSHNKGILLHQSCHNLSYDHGCPPKIIKTQTVVTEHICIIQALFSPHEPLHI